MRDKLKDALERWKKFTLLQKAGSLVACAVLVYYLITQTTSSFSPYPSSGLTKKELVHLRAVLQQEKIPFQEKKEGDLWVPHKELKRIKQKLPKENKGFELFDSSTWMKGEKELQILELRALKGEIEKELCSFEKIQNAHLILDMPRIKDQQRPKASLILTLIPEARLSLSEIRAISSHVAAAIPRLEREQITISDTTGKLYQEIGLHNPLDFLERQAQDAIEGFLICIAGKEHFYSHVSIDKEDKLSIKIVLDEQKGLQTSRDTIFKQVEAIGACYSNAVCISIEYIPFATHLVETKGAIRKSWLFLLLLLLPLVFLFKKKLTLESEAMEEKLTRLIQGSHVEELAHAIRRQNPKIIAILLTYMDPARVEKIVSTLPDSLQEEVLIHLSEMEQEHVS